MIELKIPSKDAAGIVLDTRADGRSEPRPGRLLFKGGEDPAGLKDAEQPFGTLLPLILEDYPVLRQVSVVLKMNRFGDHFSPGACAGSAKIVLRDLRDSELIRISERYPFQMESLAGMLGLSHYDLISRPWAIRSFMAAHEYGHAYVFFTRRLPCARTYEGAVETEQDERLREYEGLPAKMPNPSFLLLSEAERQKIASREGYRSIEALMLANQYEYLRLPSESAANSFAASFLRRHTMRAFAP